MADNEAKQALLGALGAFLEGDRNMGEMDEILPALQDYLQLFARSDFVCAMVPNPPARVAEYPGVGGLAEAWGDWGETFESVRADADELREGEDAVILFVTQFAVTKHGGVEMTQPSAMLWLFEDGLVRRLEFHLDRRAALAAGGMTP
jgi:ketosteroid isomerase-like protein